MENNNVIATYCICNFGGIEILNIEYDIIDRIVYRYNFGDNAENKIHKARIHYGERDYFNTNYGMKVFLDECIRV